MSVNYIRKINDFKNAFSDAINPEMDVNKRNVIDALFDNVCFFYEEYKDDIKFIPAQYETYRYHIIQPVNGGYHLLDFLLNRAISNVDEINFSDNENAFDRRRIVKIKLDRYDKYANKILENELEMQRYKSLLHETAHAIRAIDTSCDDKVHTLDMQIFLKKVKSFQKLRNKYSSIINPEIVINKEITNNTFGTKPFFAGFENDAASSLLDECSTEIDAVKNSGLLTSKFGNYVNIDNAHTIFVPNHFNGYAMYQIFLYQLKKLISKDSYFSSTFFGTSDAMDEFCKSYSSQILYAARGHVADNNNALKTMYNLLNKAWVAISFGNKSYDTYKVLSYIFIECFRKKIYEIQNTDTELLMSYKNIFAVSYNQAPLLIEDGQFRPTGIKNMYKMFHTDVDLALSKLNCVQQKNKL